MEAPKFRGVLGASPAEILLAAGPMLYSRGPFDIKVSMLNALAKSVLLDINVAKFDSNYRLCQGQPDLKAISQHMKMDKDMI
jgi:hypothetical protein